MRRKLYLKDAGPAFLTAYIAMFALQFVISFSAVFDNIAANSDATELSDATTWALIICNQVAFFGATMFYVNRKRIDFFGEIGIKRKMSGKQLALLPLISLAAICAFLPLANGFVALFELTGYTYEGTTFENGNLLFMIFAVAVLPAFGEEFLFRGIITTAGKEKSHAFAIIMSAAMFSIMHGSPVQTVHQFGLGLIFGYVLCLTGDIKYSMILHFLNNFLSIVLDEVFVIIGLNTVELPLVAAIPVEIILCIVGLLALIMLLKEFTRLSRDKNMAIAGEAYPDGKFKTLLKSSAYTLIGLFKRGGLRAALNSMNEQLDTINPRSYPVDFLVVDSFEGFGEEDGIVPPRKVEVPSSLKLAFLIIILVWLVQTALGYTDLL